MSLKAAIRYTVSRISFLNQLVAIWKIFRKRKYMLPNAQVVVGGHDKKSRQKILDRFCKCYPEFVTEFKVSALGTLEESKLKKTGKLFFDMLWCRIAYGFQPDEYVIFDFVNKDEAERKMFISDIYRFELFFMYNNIHDCLVFADKYNTYLKFRKYYGRNAIKIKTQGDYIFFEKFVRKYEKIVIKNPVLCRGESVRFVDTTGLPDTKIFELFSNIINENSAIIEELIDQGEELKCLHPSSVNTLRLTTIMTNGEVTVFYPFIKIGQANSFVDNGGKGGILAGIDIETGKICSEGLDEVGKKYVKHPDTDILIKGYQMPKWGACISVVKECAAEIPSVRIVGWDVAWSTKGWIIVEGNFQSQFIGQQGTIGRGLKKELLKALKVYSE